MKRRGGRLDQRRVGARTELDDEIRHHLQERADLLVAAGLSPEEARVEALRRFGDVERLEEEVLAIEVDTGRWFEAPRAVLSDLAQAGRRLRGSLTFSASVVATVAIGIGAATSIFSVADSLLVRPLPVSDVERWMEVDQTTAPGHWGLGLRTDRVPAWQESSGDVFDAWVVYQRQSLTRVDGERPQQMNAVAVTPGTAELLGIPIVIGRGFTRDEGTPGAPPVVILGYDYWRRLGADPAIVGRDIRLQSGPAMVVGVLGDVKFPSMGPASDFWVPLRSDFTTADRRVPFSQGVWARLREGVTLEAAQARVDALAPGLEAAAGRPGTWAIHLEGAGGHRGNPDTRRALELLSGTGLMILLIALVNSINLVLIRGSARARELVIRATLGASRLRLARLLFSEGVMLGLVSGVAAVLVAWATLRGMRGLIPEEVVYFSPFELDVGTRTIVAIFLAAALAGLCLGLAPALQLTGDVAVGSPGAAGLRDDTRKVRLVRSGLIVAQVALSTTLLSCAAVFGHGFIRLMRVDPGFDEDRVALALLSPSPRYANAPGRAELAHRLEAALAARPEIESASVTSGSGLVFGAQLQAEGGTVRLDQPTLVPLIAVEPGYLETIGTKPIRGRLLEAADIGTDNTVVDRDLARFLWGDADPIGRRYKVEEKDPWLTVVGMVEDLRLEGRDQRQGPFQIVRAAEAGSAGPTLEVAMRTTGRPELLLPVFESTLRQVDPEQPIWRLRTATAALAEKEEKPRFLVTLMGLLAAVGVGLAAIGLYGVLAYSVERRRREFGVRIALGAERGRVLRLVLGAGWTMASVGVALGMAAAWGLAKPMQPLLYEVDAREAASAAVTVALMLAIATLASMAPAVWATRADPVEALKSE